MALRRIEEKVLCDLNCRNHVIATGGSAAYSHAAMTHLKARGIVIFLDVDLPTLESRIHNFDTRGLANRPINASQTCLRSVSLYTLSMLTSKLTVST